VKVESPKSNNIARWFTPQTQLKEFKKFFNSRTALGYVSDVTYGVISIFSFEFSSKHSKTDIDAMVRVFTGSGVVSGGVNTSWEKMSSNTRIAYRRSGGEPDTISASQDLKTLQGEITRMRESFGKLDKNNLPLPIEYTIKSLKTKKTILVGQSVKYNEKSCTQKPNYISLEMQGGFFGYFIVWWDEPGKPRQRKEYNKKKEGWRFIHKFPKGSTAIQLEIKARRRGGGKMAVLFNETPELGYNYRLGGTDYPRASLKREMME
jgi:hypothetical protein